MPTISTNSQEQAYCNACKNNTWHKPRGECEAQSQVLDEPSRVTVHFSDIYTLLQCSVCGQARMRMLKWNSENDHGSPHFYPPPHVRKPPDWLKELPAPHSRLMAEAYQAIDAGLYAIAFMGVRAVLDVWVSSQTSDQNNFPTKLERIAQLGGLGAKQVVILTDIFNAGSAAAHRGHSPSLEDVGAALDSVENLLHQDLLVPHLQTLKQNTPQRPRK